MGGSQASRPDTLESRVLDLAKDSTYKTEREVAQTFCNIWLALAQAEC